jgi:small subunit ribosomal protein S7
MPRRNQPAKREVTPDLKYNSLMLHRFINRIMRKGKKATAMRVVYDTVAMVEERAKKPGLQVLEEALKNLSPSVEVKPRRVGGATLQVPVEVSGYRQESLAMRWLIAESRKRGGKSMAEKLAAEVMDAANNTGAAIKKREETHKMAEANRAFAHFRW